jgi:hypothetical protein
MTNPKIHDIGKIFRSDTFQEAGVAVHKEEDFNDRMVKVYQALNTAIGEKVP